MPFWVWAYAGLGEAASAVAEGQKAMVMRPTSKDPFEGPAKRKTWRESMLYWGMRSTLFPFSSDCCRYPMEYAITPALLRLDPIWDQIRNDPRFQELAAEKKP